jgi:4-hydroxybenzoate polyprenyltransferase/phosphoserine phosphatase
MTAEHGSRPLSDASGKAGDPSRVPLCVDLDYTLIRTDSLVECLLDVARQHPAALLKLPAWLIAGRAVLKQKLAESCDFDPATLPYRQELLDDLREARQHDRTLVLVTAADSKIANKIAEYLGLFQLVLASNGQTNLKGKSKRQAVITAFGSGQFDYAGDNTDDISVWKSARRAWIVGRPALVERAKMEQIEVERVYPPQRIAAWRAFWRALRPHQWVKNLLVFVPIAAAHSFLDLTRWWQAGLMFVAFSMAASAGYIVNDLLDVRSDRVHASKKTRPFASGDLPLPFGIAAPVLFSLAFAIAFFLPERSALVVITYSVVSFLYSKILKARPIADVIVLTCLYCLRIIAGGESTRIPVSVWLLSLSTFIFLSLALAKRSTELRLAERSGQLALTGRGYRCADLPLVDAMGVASGYLSSMVMMVYLLNTETLRLYRHPHYLWLVLPILLAWVSHMWLTAHRGEMTEDPVVFAATNSTSLCLAAAAAVVTVAAI